jgi:carboxymethylenebutenolidase
MATGGGGTAELGGDDSVRKFIASLPPEQITGDLNAVTDFVSKLPAANGKVAVCGFCWRGGQSLRFARNNREIKAAFVFYGTEPDNEEDIARITGPVYRFYGGNDARVDSTIPVSTELTNEPPRPRFLSLREKR